MAFSCPPQSSGRAAAGHIWMSCLEACHRPHSVAGTSEERQHLPPGVAQRLLSWGWRSQPSPLILGLGVTLGEGGGGGAHSGSFLEWGRGGEVPPRSGAGRGPLETLNRLQKKGGLRVSHPCPFLGVHVYPSSPPHDIVSMVVSPRSVMLPPPPARCLAGQVQSQKPRLHASRSRQDSTSALALRSTLRGGAVLFLS